MLVLLSACGGSSSVPENRAEVSSAMRSNDAANALEALAAESGVIGEDITANPVGSYGRTYDGGEDRLCVLSSLAAEKSHQFGIEIRIGEEEYCRGKGAMKRAGDLMIFRFAGGRCTITARYEGDRIIMPGAVDSGCASLCSARGSFAGVSFPRVGQDADAAYNVMGSDGQALCG